MRADAGCGAVPPCESASRRLAGHRRPRVAVREGDGTRQGRRLTEVSDGESEGTGLHAVAQVGARESQSPRRHTEREASRRARDALDSLESEQPRRGEADAGDLVPKEKLDDVRSR